MLTTSVKCVSKRFDFVKMSNGTSNIYETSTHSGEDAWFIGNNVFGIADGVSGWKTKGVSSAFSSSLMMESDNYSKSNPKSHPIEILEKAYNATKNNVIGGSSTACIAKLNGSILNVVNHGDSGMIVIRDKRIIFQTSTDYIDGDCPYQLGQWDLNEDNDDHQKHCKEVANLYNQIGRKTADTKIYEFQVTDNDIIIMATDGFFDNIHENEIIESCEFRDPHKISLDLIKKSIKNTMIMNPRCIDDITIIVSTVNTNTITVINDSYSCSCFDNQCECKYCVSEAEESKRKKYKHNH